MKTMTCRQLGGACDEPFSAATFEEMGELSRQHAMAMMQQGDPAHLEAMEKMKVIMGQPGKFEEWYEAKRKEFDALPDES